MYVSNNHYSDSTPRVYRVHTDIDIWVELSPDTKVALTLAEAQHLITGLNRELNAAQVEARGIAA